MRHVQGLVAMHQSLIQVEDYRVLVLSSPICCVRLLFTTPTALIGLGELYIHMGYCGNHGGLIFASIAQELYRSLHVITAYLLESRQFARVACSPEE